MSKDESCLAAPFSDENGKVYPPFNENRYDGLWSWAFENCNCARCVADREKLTH